MQCPECGYMMSAFDKECPRCVHMGKSEKPKPPAAPLPTVPQDNPVSMPVKPQSTPAEVPTSSEENLPEFSQETPMMASTLPFQNTRKASDPALVITLTSLGVLFAILILFAMFHSSNADKVASSAAGGSSADTTPPDNTAFVAADSPPQDVLTTSGLTVSQGPPEMIGKRSWSAEITVRNNCEIPLAILDAKLKFDDFSEQSLYVNDKNGKHNAYIGQSVTPKIDSGKSENFSFYADDLSDNATKKPTKLVIQVMEGEIDIPVSPN